MSIEILFRAWVTSDVLVTWHGGQVPSPGQDVALDGVVCKVGRVLWHGPYRVSVYVTETGEFAS